MSVAGMPAAAAADSTADAIFITVKAKCGGWYLRDGIIYS